VAVHAEHASGDADLWPVQIDTSLMISTLLNNDHQRIGAKTNRTGCINFRRGKKMKEEESDYLGMYILKISSIDMEPIDPLVLFILKLSLS
jgi:hypothetical protein